MRRIIAEVGVDQCLAIDGQREESDWLSVKEEQEAAHLPLVRRREHGVARRVTVRQSGIEEARLIGLARQGERQVDKLRDFLGRCVSAHVQFSAIGLREFLRLAPQGAARLAREAREVIVKGPVHRDVVAAEVLACASDMVAKGRTDSVGERLRRGQNPHAVRGIGARRQ